MSVSNIVKEEARMKLFVVVVAMAVGISSLGSGYVSVVQDKEIDSDTDAKIEKGLNFLAKKQTSSGSLGGSVSVATTAMSGLAWLANGSTPERGKYSENIYKALKYILKCTGKNGLIQESTGGYSSMQGHGFATLFLSESLGMIADPTLYNEVKDKLKLAVKFLEKSQNKYGGWGDSGGGPESTQDGSGAVAIMQINALRSARNQGLVISEKVINKAKKYLNEMTNEDGSYSYNYGSRGPRQSSGLTGAGMYMIGAMGMYKDNKRYEKGIKYLMTHAPFMKKSSADYGWTSWEYFTLFYASLAIFQYGGNDWKEWYPKMRNMYCKKQSGSGEWGPDSYNGLWTAFTLLALQLPYRTLPIMQQGGRGAEGQ